MIKPAAFLALALAANVQAGQLMQGPMLGHVDHDSARVWARAGGEARVSIRYGLGPEIREARETAAVAAEASNDYCVEIEIPGLEANAFYHYQVLLDGEPLDSPRERQGYPLLTAPAPDAPARFSIGFGAGAKADADGLQAIWLQVQNARPHAFFWLGDNESAEDLAPAFQAEQYRKQRNVPFLQPLLRSIPQLATWGGRLDAREPKSLEVFRRYWANPAYGTREAPGSYFKHHYAGVDFFFLDTYSYRSESAAPTLLGEGQTRWLKSGLAASSARFKIILSSSSWTTLPAGKTATWTAYPDERASLLGYIRDAKIDGVVLLSGGASQAEIKAIPMSSSGGYDLYELVSSPLAQDPDHAYGELEASTIEIQPPYADSMNFGILDFDLTGADPSLSFEIINVFGESVFPAFVLKSSELVNGVSSWQTKLEDPGAFVTLSETAAYPE